MIKKKYLVNEDTNEKFVINGCIPSSTPSDIPQFKTFMLYHDGELPPAVDLRPFMQAVENQGETSSCVANALAGSYEYLLKRHQIDNIDVSRMFLYYNTRLRSFPGSPIADRGCFISKGIESLQAEGTCLEKEWPFIMQAVNTKPEDQLYETAKSNTVVQAVQLDIDLNQMRSCLAQGYPFVFSLALYRSFSVSSSNGGMVPTPIPGELPIDVQNRHAMLAVGYDHPYQLFIVRNSWGPSWGDKGYVYIPYNYLCNPQYCSEAFSMRKFDNMDLGHEHWITDPSQIHISSPTAIIAAAHAEMNKWVVKEEDDDDENKSEATVKPNGEKDEENSTDDEVETEERKEK